MEILFSFTSSDRVLVLLVELQIMLQIPLLSRDQTLITCVSFVIKVERHFEETAFQFQETSVFVSGEIWFFSQN